MRYQPCLKTVIAVAWNCCDYISWREKQKKAGQGLTWRSTLGSLTELTQPRLVKQGRRTPTLGLKTWGKALSGWAGKFMSSSRTIKPRVWLDIHHGMGKTLFSESWSGWCHRISVVCSFDSVLWNKAMYLNLHQLVICHLKMLLTLSMCVRFVYVCVTPCNNCIYSKHPGWRLSQGQNSPYASWETSSTAMRPKLLICHTWTSRLWRSWTRTKSWSRNSVWSGYDLWCMPPFIIVLY